MCVLCLYIMCVFVCCVCVRACVVFVFMFVV